MSDAEADRIQRRRLVVLATDIPKYHDDIADRVKESFVRFLDNYIDAKTGHRIYLDQIRQELTSASDYHVMDENMSTDGDVQREHRHRVLFVNMNHVLEKDQVLADAIQREYFRFQDYLLLAVTLVADRLRRQSTVASGEMTAAAGVATSDKSNSEWSLAFYGQQDIFHLRQLRTHHIGNLVAISGTVTRSSTTHPQLHLARFRCKICATPYANTIEQQFVYTTPPSCQNPSCGNRREWDLEMDRSVFQDWQKLRIQENAGEVPAGAIPRSIEVIIRGQTWVEKVRPGDRCVFTGSLVVVPDTGMLMRGVGAGVESRADPGRRAGRDAGTGGGVTGLKSLGVRELGYRLAFVASCIQVAEAVLSTSSVTSGNVSSTTNLPPGVEELVDGQSGDHDSGEEDRQRLLQTFSEQEVAQLKAMIQQGANIYPNLVRSIAPTVFGKAFPYLLHAI